MKTVLLILFATSTVAIATKEYRRCGKNAKFCSYTTTCPVTCENRDQYVSCESKAPGCKCRDGYIFKTGDLKGDCVREWQCPISKCGVNEEYTDCGSACPETCDNYGKSQICTLQCVAGCFCKSGLVRNKEGKCVDPRQCPKKCGVNEEYTDCGSACPETCDNYGQPQFCTKQCVAGCFCKSGLVRNKEGKCVDPRQCPKKVPQCGKNAIYSKSASICPVTCKDRGNIRCQAVAPGCKCKTGYIFKNDQKGDCVKEDQCPEECGKNAEYVEFTSGCPKTCLNRGQTATCYVIGPGCECKKGYIFKTDQKSDCVKEDQCPKQCGKNAEYVEYASGCPKTCENRGQTGTCFVYGPGCECKEGYIFKTAQNGDCVKEDQCPNVPTKCGKHATYENFTSVCPETCENRGEPKCLALGPGCKCDKGYIFKDAKKIDCVKECQCPKTQYCPNNPPIFCIRAEYQCCDDDDCDDGCICCRENCGNICREPQYTKSENGTKVTYDENCKVDEY